MDTSRIFKLKTTISLEGMEQLRQYYTRARTIGQDTARYTLQMIMHARMEQRLLDGCKALLSLRLVYGEKKLEKACKRGLLGNRYNYTTIKNILLNHLEEVPMPTVSVSSDTTGDPVTPKTLSLHENLRGASFFDF